MYLVRLPVHVREVTSYVLPDRFALVIDGQITAASHYVSVFVMVSDYNTHGYSTVFLVLSPSQNEEKMTADVHINILHLMMWIFGTEPKNVVVLVGAICFVHKLISRKMDIQLIDCPSHRFEPAVKEIISKRQYLVSFVHRLMCKFRSPHCLPRSYLVSLAWKKKWTTKRAGAVRTICCSGIQN